METRLPGDACAQTQTHTDTRAHTHTHECTHTHTQIHTNEHTHTHTCFLEAEPAHTRPDPSHHGPWPGREWVQAGPGGGSASLGILRVEGHRGSLSHEGCEVGSDGDSSVFLDSPQPSSLLFCLFPSLAELEKQAASPFPTQGKEKGM